MRNITIATFISNKEKENNEFFQLIEYLKNYFNIQVIVLCDKKLENKEIPQIITPNMTKYKRIKLLINKAENNHILCIDNDISPNKENILNFINNCFRVEYSIAWGKIKAKNIKGFIPRLISIDKNLSHDYIRPTLWNLKLGISLPGQVFMINKKFFLDKLPNIDTVYDDLMIGCITKENNYPVYFVKDVLGYETPKANFMQLLNQRIRWAKGLSETIIYNKKSQILPYILLHGFAFNLLWIPIYFTILLITRTNLILGICITLLISYFLAKRKIKNVIWAILYMLVFPIVYVVWAVSLINNLNKSFNKRGDNKNLWNRTLKNYYWKQRNSQREEL